jgi:hypothetical protein
VTGTTFPPKKSILTGNPKLLGNYWVICNLASMGSNPTDSKSQDLLTATISSSKAGRPKGSTMQKKREDINNYKECVNAITEEYHNKLTFHKENRQRLLKGQLEAIIE